MLLCAIYEGFKTDRWEKADPEEVAHFAERLKSVPTAFGDWVSTPVEVDERQNKAAGIAGQFTRNFRNKVTGDEISVFLVCGPSRDMIIHSPDQCYVAAGFKLDGEDRRETVAAPSGPAEFFNARFVKQETLEKVQLEILWSWSYAGVWEAPSVTRMHYAGKPALYKVYAIHKVVGQNAKASKESANVTFLKEFLPKLDQALFQDRAPAPAA